MPTVAGIKIKTKPSKIRNPLFADEKYTGPEPVWPEEANEWSDDEFDHFLRRSFRYYNYYYTQKDTKKFVVEWAKTVKEFTKEDVRDFERSSDRWLPMTACSLVMAHRKGMPLRTKHVEFLIKTIRDCIEGSVKSITGVQEEEAKTKTPAEVAARPSIQDRLAEKTSELIGELEGHYDEMNTSQLKFYDWFVSKNVIQSQLNKYENVFQSRLAELELAQSKSDPQLKEAYSHYRAADFKKRIGWISDLLSAIEQYRGVKKAAKKARVKKAPSKEKVVSKLKYAKENKPLKIVSINPADIIGAAELWVYNIKTRKLGKYVAASYQTLNIKGTTIIGFDEDKSVAKTLRKPEEQLKEFAKAGKVALRTYLKDIKAVEVKLNGRINTDTVLLRIA